MPAILSPDRLRFGVFEFDPATGDLWKAGHATRLQEQPRQVLGMLLARPGELITRDQLRGALWPEDTFVDFDTGLNVVVNKIRHALGDSAASPRFIETLPRRGYRFVAPVTRAEFPVSSPSVNRRRHTFLLALVGCGLAAAAAWWFLGRLTTPTVASLTPVRSLAVLPLENLSGGAADDYLVAGVTEGLITDLGAIRALRVISRQSTKRYQGSTKTVTTIGKELDVDAVIEGSVRRSGSRVRLNVQLTDARSNRHIWAGSYERDVDQVAQLQQEATAEVAREIHISMTQTERARVGRSRPLNPAAYDAYLRGRYLLTGLPESEVDTSRALAAFQQAAELDPLYARAYVGIAEAHQLRGTFLGGHPPLVERRLAFAAGRRAADLDPQLGEAHAIIARVQLSEFDWSGAGASFARMREFAPNHAPGLVWDAYFLQNQGRFAEALDTARQAEAVDPLDLNTRVRVGFVHRFARQPEQALRRYLEVLALDGDNMMARAFLIVEYASVQKHAEAVAAATEALRRRGRTPLTLSHLAFAHGRAGERTQAEDLIQELLSLSRRQYVSPAHLALAYVGLDDRDRAFEWFERAYEERSNLMMFYPVDPFWAWPDDARYVRLVKKIRAAHHVR